jgi:anti-anti-sigma factor
VRTRDMRIDHATHPLNGVNRVNGVNGVEHLPFSLSISTRDGHRVVRICGELDIVSRSQVRQACLEGLDDVVEVEMAETTFMDCCGYGALVAARQALQEQGGSLTLHHQVGQPAELLTMLSVLAIGS